MSRRPSAEKATVTLKIRRSTHQNVMRLAAELYTSQADAVDTAVRQALAAVLAQKPDEKPEDVP